MLISAIAFDIGNVLVRVYHSKTRAAFAEFAGSTEEEIRGKLFGQLHDEVERGLLTPEDFRRRASALLGKDIPFPFFQQAWNDVFEENREILPILEQVERTYKIFLISNTDPLHFAHLQKFEAISRFFADPNRRILSFECGTRKPEKAIYDELAKKSGIGASETLYIDDTAQFVEAFRTLGGHALQYDARKDPITLIKDEFARLVHRA